MNRMHGRREFLWLGGTALVSLGLPRSSEADSPRGALVIVLLRGAADGLHMVAPYRDPRYRSLRGALALKEPGRGESPAHDLGDGFAFHPALSPLYPHYRYGRLAAVVNVGSPDPTRSHFDAQDYMDSGTPGLRASRDGWLGRALAELDEAPRGAFAGVSLTSRMPRTLAGTSNALALADFSDLDVDRSTEAWYARLERAYARDHDSRFVSAGEEAFRAMRDFRERRPGAIPVGEGARYASGRSAERFRQLAQLLKADLGVRAAVIESEGWDTHFAQGRETGQMAGLLGRLAQNLAALLDDVARLPVTILVATEFGRTVAPNGAGGTDHGHGGVMLVMGSGVRGGRVHGDWVGLAPSELYQGRDLPVTLDFRDVFAEAASLAFGPEVLPGLFPGHERRPVGVVSPGAV